MKTIVRLALVAVAAFALTSCDAKNDKFNAKEYAQHKTERLDQAVNLTDAQKKEVFALYLEQGKEIAGHIKAMKKVECDKPACDKKADCTKKADCKKADCTKKAECKQAECNKKADCKKDCATCDKKNDCKKVDCKKADCTKKAECKKVDCKKDCATCDKKAECKKADCTKKAECNKVCDKKRRPHHRPMVKPEAFKAHIKKLAAILTPEQMELLKASKVKRFECAPKTGECCPTTETCAK